MTAPYIAPAILNRILPMEGTGMCKQDFLPAEEQGFYDSVVHDLRSRGWTRSEAEGEALDRIEKLRAKKAAAQ